MKEILELCYEAFKEKKPLMDKHYDYYKGNTDAMKEYRKLTERSNSKVNVNYVKKFIKEEVSYSIGNDINYVSKSGDKNIVNDIELVLSNSPTDHDIDLFKDMLIYSYAFELYSFDDAGEFKMSVLTPDEAFLYQDESGAAKLFLHVFTDSLTGEIGIKVYTDTEVIYYTEDFTEYDRRIHKFKEVPVGFARVSDELENDSIFKDIKGLQDALEIMLSNSVNENSDHRNAYLVVNGMQILDEDIPKMKENTIIQTGQAEGSVEWLIKDINDTFIQNTLENLESKMYEVTNHINFNEKMNSNTSALAMKTRLTALTQKCELQQKAFSNCIQTRLKFLLAHLNFTKNVKRDWRDVEIIFTANIPSDDLSTAQLLNMLEGTISQETALGQLPFIGNPKDEINRLEKEEDRKYGSELDTFKEDGLDE